MYVHYVTSNLRKFQEASYILKTSKEWNLVHLPVEIEEIQATPFEIVHYKAKSALERLQVPLIVEDVAFTCPLLGGLPGPYVKHFLHSLGPEGLANLIIQASAHEKKPPIVEVSCHAVYIAPGGKPIYAVGAMQGMVVPFRDPTGEHAKSWNGIYVQNGQERAFSEMSLEEISQISMRQEALTCLLESYRHVCT